MGIILHRFYAGFMFATGILEWEIVGIADRFGWPVERVAKIPNVFGFQKGAEIGQAWIDGL